MTKNRQKLLYIVGGCIALLVAVILVLRLFGYDVFDRSGWKIAENGDILYLDYSGDPLTGWLQVEGLEYYFAPDSGAMVTGWLQTGEGRFYLDDGGQKTLGWADLDGLRYYFDPDGKLHTGWLTLGAYTFYLSEDGAMHTGWLDTDAGRHFFDTDGRMHTGWLDADEGRFYLSHDGILQTGWLETGDGLAYLSETGAVSPGWVDTPLGRAYIAENGLAHIGWLEEDGKRYYLTKKGLLHTGWLELGEDSYFFHDDGVMAVGKVDIDGESHYFTSTGKRFVLVNPWNYVPEGYTMELADFGEYKIAAQCLQPLEQLRDAIVGEGMTFNLTSAYRSQEYQTGLFMKKVNKLMEQGYSYGAAYNETSRSIAIPGTSEHQLGLAVDVKSGSRVYEWLQEHSWEYGFIVRYPSGDTALTGIYYEPWHLRYVGVELAKELYELDMCVEAYMNMLTETAN